MRNVMSVTVILALMALPVLAKPALRDVAVIDNGLLAVGVADRIRKNCPDISARMFKALRYVRSLEAQARAMGYSKDEIRAYTDSNAEKARMKARGAAYFKANGVIEGDAQTYCTLGRAEIEKSSQIGALLRVK
ncbi:MAG: DUF5333 domain-containing protein [Sulfitobacter sp.]